MSYDPEAQASSSTDAAVEGPRQEQWFLLCGASASPPCTVGIGESWPPAPPSTQDYNEVPESEADLENELRQLIDKSLAENQADYNEAPESEAELENELRQLIDKSLTENQADYNEVPDSEAELENELRQLIDKALSVAAVQSEIDFAGAWRTLDQASVRAHAEPHWRSPIAQWLRLRWPLPDRQ